MAVQDTRGLCTREHLMITTSSTHGHAMSAIWTESRGMVLVSALMVLTVLAAIGAMAITTTTIETKI